MVDLRSEGQVVQGLVSVIVLFWFLDKKLYSTLSLDLHPLLTYFFIKWVLATPRLRYKYLEKWSKQIMFPGILEKSSD